MFAPKRLIVGNFSFVAKICMVILIHYGSRHLTRFWSSHVCWIWSKTKKFVRKKMISFKMFYCSKFPALNLKSFASFSSNSWLELTYFYFTFCLRFWSIIYMVFPLHLNNFGSYIGGKTSKLMRLLYEVWNSKFLISIHFELLDSWCIIWPQDSRVSKRTNQGLKCKDYEQLVSVPIAC